MKFVILSYLPVLAVNEKGLSTIAASLALALAAAAGGIGALLASRLTRRLRVSLLLGVCICTLTVTLLGIAISTATINLLLSATVYGLADGLLSVVTNSMVAQAVEERSRATFVAFTGSFRNLGKFAAPVMVAGIAALGSLSLGFVITGMLALVTLIAVRPLARFDAVFYGRGGSEGPTDAP